MISEQTTETNPAIELLKSGGHNVVGFSHDNANRIYPWCPPDDLLVGIEEHLLYTYVSDELDTAEQDAVKQQTALITMVAQTATFMASDSANILTGEHEHFKMMKETAHHNIWIGESTYTFAGVFDSTRFDADFLEVFGQPPGTTTPAQASAQIKQYLTGA